MLAHGDIVLNAILSAPRAIAERLAITTDCRVPKKPSKKNGACTCHTFHPGSTVTRSNGVAIAEMTHCINSVLHAVDAAIVHVVFSIWTLCLMQTLN